MVGLLDISHRETQLPEQQLKNHVCTPTCLQGPII